MVGYILLEDFLRINPGLEIKVHSDDLDNTGIGPVSIYYPAGEDGYRKIDEHLVKVVDEVMFISTLPLWSGDGTGQEAVLTVTGPGTAEFTSYCQEDGQGRYILPAEGDTRSLPEEWVVPLQEGQYYWLYSQYSYGIDNLVVLQDGYLFTVQVRQDDEVLYPRPARHWFWSGHVDSMDGISYEICDNEYSEQQFRELDMEDFGFNQTFVEGVWSDVTCLRDGGYEFRGFVSAQHVGHARLQVQEYLDSFPREGYKEEADRQYEVYLGTDYSEEVDMSSREEDRGQDMTHWEDNLSREERNKEAWWKFYHACRRMKNRLRDAYLDWRYGKPIPLPDHPGRKKYRPGQPDKIIRSRR